MVVIDTDLNRLSELIGKKIEAKELEDLAFNYGLDVSIQDSLVSFEITSERSDIATVHSIAFLLSQIMGNPKKIDPSFDTIDFPVKVESKKRNKIVLLVLELKKSDPLIQVEIAQLTDKISETLGRRRKIAGVGAFDFDKIQPPLVFKEVKDISFIPLGFNKELTLKDILEQTYQGRAYNFGEYYAWFSNNEPIALVPIINADKFSIKDNTKRVLFEISGEDQNVVNSIAISILFNAKLLGKVYAIKGFEPKIEKREITTNKKQIEDLLGIKINIRELKSKLKNMGFVVKSKGEEILVEVPFYRQDIISYADIADEYLRLIGANTIGYEVPKSFNPGKYLESENKIRAIRNILLSQGFQEAFTSILSSKFYQEELINEKGIVAGEHYLRQYIFPELLKFYNLNKEKGGPYYFFDIDYVIRRDEGVDVKYKNALSLSLFIADEKRNLSWLVSILKQVMDRVINNTFSIIPSEHPSFIPGRFGKIIVNGKEVGLVGEIHPKILNQLGIEIPISILEVLI